MLVTWSWLDSFGNVNGQYQSDTEDLRAFMRRYSRFSGMKMLYCERQDGNKYLWRSPRWFEKSGWLSL